MIKTISFYGNKIDKENCYVFKDDVGDKYLLDESIQPVKGMNPFVYDKLPFLKIKAKIKLISEKKYIIQVLQRI